MSYQTSANCFSADGPLASYIEGFAVRAGQQDMALAIEQAIDNNSQLICEAGTGTGKTFAYLVPALLSSSQVVISTGTKTLQDQLFHKDIPLVKSALNSQADVALLKGRANYLCWYRFELHRKSYEFSQVSSQAQLQSLADWATTTPTGDLSEVLQAEALTSVWPAITSTNENCVGQECADYQRCFVVKARRAAQEADLIIINHHLFFADAVIRREGFGELLPEAGAHIFDEAHQLPELASLFFSQSVGHLQLMELARDCQNEAVEAAKEFVDLRRLTEQLMQQSNDLLFALGEEQRRPWQQLSQQHGVTKGVESVRLTLQELSQLLTEASKHHTNFSPYLQRANSLLNRLQATTGQAEEDTVQWVEIRRRSYGLNATPLSVGRQFQELLETKGGAWVFTSATLSVNGGFDHFTDGMGLRTAVCERWESPFDYSAQALLYLPKDLPPPNSHSYTKSMMTAILPLLKASHGRAFLLFTSYKALKESAKLLRAETDYTLFIQGEMPKSQILADFRTCDNAVLLGTNSFWEGVDVKGEALSCVIIDKLPFASPSDPVLQARLEAMSQQGQNGFMQIQIPQAVIMLKQGVGRLIRDEGDHGVMVICDPRLTHKSYGKIFLRSLPPMPVTHDINAAQLFFSDDPR
ncbi:MAG TPA: helicase [Gammaproteobacteria bacterium]|nr:helicase [Gammaproteobacteria bacterium]